MSDEVKKEVNMSNNKHPPLRRAGNTPLVNEMSKMSHAMVFPTNSAPPPSSLTSSLSMPLIESSPDSCYSSCSEIGSHPSLSRESSDNATLTNAFSTQCSINPSTTDHIEFASKLGYNQEQIQLVLQNIRPNAGQVMRLLYSKCIIFV